MVSVIDRHNYLRVIQANDKLLAFYNVLNDKPYVVPSSIIDTEITQIYYGICESICNTNKQQFFDVYNIISRREPSSDSHQPYINDDLLIFLLIVGIVKFKVDKDWISKVIKARSKLGATITFENLISENYYSNNSVSALTICFLFLNEISFQTGFLNSAYLSIVNNFELLDNKSDLIKISSLRALDLIIILKDIDNTGEYAVLKKMKTKMYKRLNTFSVVVYNILLFLVLFIVIKILPHFVILKKFIDDHVNLFTFLALLGFVGINLIPVAKKWFVRKIFILMGYPKELI